MKLNYLFDVDGTLIDFMDQPKMAVLEILKALAAAGHTIYVGSGGGVDYANMVCRRLGISDIVTVIPKPFAKKDMQIKQFDCAFDDAADMSAVSTTTLTVDGWFAKL